MTIIKTALIKEVGTLMEKAGSFSLGQQFTCKGNSIALEVQTNVEKKTVIIKFLQVPSLKSAGPKLAGVSVLLENKELGLLPDCKGINKHGKVVFRNIRQGSYVLGICP